MASSYGILKSSSVGPLDSRHCDFTCGVCPVCCGACTECNVLSCAKVIFVPVMGKERRCVIWIFDSLTNPKPKSLLLDQEKPAFYGAELLYRSEEVGHKEFLPFSSIFAGLLAMLCFPVLLLTILCPNHGLTLFSRREAWLILQLAMKVVKSSAFFSAAFLGKDPPRLRIRVPWTHPDSLTFMATWLHRESFEDAVNGCKWPNSLNSLFNGFFNASNLPGHTVNHRELQEE